MTRTFHGWRRLVFLTCIALSISSPLMAQQHGQYQPGQYGLNAGIMPDPGISYGDYNLNYNANQLNLENGTPVKATGTYNIWAVENFFFYVPKFKILGAKFAPFVAFPTIGNGSVVLPFLGNGKTLGSGGFALADTWFQLANRMSVPVIGAATSPPVPPFTSPRTREPRRTSWAIGRPMDQRPPAAQT